MALKASARVLGRTGTKSMQTALNKLGFGPCHHMVEVFAHPKTMALSNSPMSPSENSTAEFISRTAAHRAATASRQ